MFREAVQNRINWLIGLTIFSVTVIVTPVSTLDPINLPKLWMLSIFSFGMIATLLSQPKTLVRRENLKLIVFSSAVCIFMLLSMLFASTSLTQQIFGVYGRNTGLLTYFCLGILFITAALATSKPIIKPFLGLMAIALGVNAIYGLLQATGHDPQDWVNPYAPVIGTLGNPNFAAALLGMGTSFAFSYLLDADVSFKFKAICSAYIIISIFDIIKSNALQGILIAAISAWLVGFFYIKYRIKKTKINIIYLTIGSVALITGILGMLQKGPLKNLLYAESISNRGDYWRAGAAMFKSHPFFGVGLDSFGDFYRSFRNSAAVLRHGPDTVSNAAHNVFIDIAATAGVFALIGYICIIILGIKAALRKIRRINEYDPFFISILTMWVGYLIQSVISINNIALSIWGWILPGLLIAIDRWEIAKDRTAVSPKKQIDFSGMTMVAGFVIGGIVGFIPFNSDSNFKHSLETGNSDLIFKAAQKWPTDASRLMYAVQVFDQNKMQDKAIILARKATLISPRNFDAWLYLYNSTSIIGLERNSILEKLRKIDPLNPKLKELE